RRGTSGSSAGDRPARSRSTRSTARRSISRSSTTPSSSIPTSRSRCSAWLWAALPPLLLGAAAGDGDVVRFFGVLGLMLVAGKFSAELAERVGQPAVLGELVAGIVLGSSVLGVIPAGPDDPLRPVIAFLAEIGVVVLLFEIGLDTDLKALARVGAPATAVALVGVAVPFLLGFLYWVSPLHGPAPSGDATTVAVCVGAALTATSVGISAPVL